MEFRISNEGLSGLQANQRLDVMVSTLWPDGTRSDGAGQSIPEIRHQAHMYNLPEFQVFIQQTMAWASKSEESH